MTISSTFHLLPGIVLLFSQYAVAWEVSCPAVIDTQSSAVSLKSDVPAPWQLSPRYMSRLWLSSIGVTQGKPENLMDLKPETKKK
ncbi:STY0301 family protein [Salmonella enterica subsp. enterica serovar Lubbock]